MDELWPGSGGTRARVVYLPPGGCWAYECDKKRCHYILLQLSGALDVNFNTTSSGIRVLQGDTVYVPCDTSVLSVYENESSPSACLILEMSDPPTWYVHMNFHALLISSPYIRYDILKQVSHHPSPLVLSTV